MTSDLRSLAATVRTARVAGALYLGIALTGLFGHLIVRTRLLDDDPSQTLSHLREHPDLARIWIALELGIVLTQALTGLWFYRLFVAVDRFNAGALAAFSFANALVILGSAGLLLAGFDVSTGTAPALGENPAGTAQLLLHLSESLWVVGQLFFGLWLIPMGWLVVRSGWMPRALGRILQAGGLGYVLAPFLAALGGSTLAAIVVIPASVGEFWMIGYLLIRGVRVSAAGAAR